MAALRAKLRGLVKANRTSKSATRHSKARYLTVNASSAEAEQSNETGTKERKPSPLEKGGTVKGKESKAKDLTESDGSNGSAFDDPRWQGGTWDLEQFKDESGKVDWDAVIDAEVRRRKQLEVNPEATTSTEPVRFTPSQIPWWAWMKRFHLPEAELVNGRAAMVGFAAAYLIDALSGAGLVKQMDSFLGKLALLLSVTGVALVRNVNDLNKYKSLIEEAIFYDKQWDATWEGVERPKETEQ